MRTAMERALTFSFKRVAANIWCSQPCVSSGKLQGQMYLAVQGLVVKPQALCGSSTEIRTEVRPFHAFAIQVPDLQHLFGASCVAEDVCGCTATVPSRALTFSEMRGGPSRQTCGTVSDLQPPLLVVYKHRSSYVMHHTCYLHLHSHPSVHNDMRMATATPVNIELAIGRVHHATNVLPPDQHVSAQHFTASQYFLLKKLNVFVVDNFMLLAFAGALLSAMVWPLPGKVVSSWQAGDFRIVQTISTILVFLISGVTLRSDEFRAVMKYWHGAVYGLVAILAITPCLGFGLLRIPIQPPEFAVGLTIFCVVPTTLGVGVALTAASKGNQALALLLLLASNVLGIVTVPYGLKLLLAGSSVLSVNPQDLVIKLLLTVLVPAVVGKLAREVSPQVMEYATKHKTALSMFSTTNLACILWQTLSGAQSILIQQHITSILLIIALSSGVHVGYLVFNAFAISKYCLRLPLREGAAVLIMSSQKSAPVAITVITYVTSNASQQGLFAIPCIIGQLAQIFIGSGLSKYLRQHVSLEETD